MNEKTKTMHNTGFIEVNGKRYNFENTVSSAFDSAINHYLARLGLTKETPPTGSNLIANVVNGFSLIAETPVENEFKLYTELGFLPMTAFEVQGLDFQMTRIRGAAISSNNGTVRGGGFNIVTKNRKSPLAAVPFLRRKVTIPVSTFYSVTNTTNWFYHYGNKAFYNFETGGKVNKISWDYETGLWGELVITTTTFTYGSSIDDIFTDGENRLFAFPSNTQMRIYDFTTDTFTTVTLQYALATSSNIRRFLGWDDVSGGLKCVTTNNLASQANTGFIINPDGTITLNTGTLPVPSTSWYPVLFEQDIIWSPLSQDNVSGSLIPADDANFNPVGTLTNIYNDATQAADQVAKMRFCPRNNNRFIFATFNSTTPTSMDINFCLKPENYITILGTTAIPVEIGDSLVIEYTFRSGT